MLTTLVTHDVVHTCHIVIHTCHIVIHLCDSHRCPLVNHAVVHTHNSHCCHTHNSRHCPQIHNDNWLRKKTISKVDKLEEVDNLDTRLKTILTLDWEKRTIMTLDWEKRQSWHSWHLIEKDSRNLSEKDDNLSTASWGNWENLPDFGMCLPHKRICWLWD